MEMLCCLTVSKRSESPSVGSWGEKIVQPALAYSFRLYRCTSTKTFKTASACPPGYCDHVHCGKIKTGLINAFRQVCRQAYLETVDHAKVAKSQTAIQFAGIRDLMAFSMLLTDDQREDIRHIRVDLTGAHYQSAEWHYFCNVFATPWDRRSVRNLFDIDYPNYKAEITFYYSYSSHDRSGVDSERALASSWVTPHVHLEWNFRNNSWGAVYNLSELRVKAPLSVRFAVPQFLSRRRNGEIEPLDETMWDDARQGILRPGDEGYIRLAERLLMETDAMQDLVTEKKKILAALEPEEKERLQKSYDEKFHYYWHEPHFNQRHWDPSWLMPLRQCQHFESFDVDFYDEDGPRHSVGLDIFRDGLKECFTSLSIGPHPFPLYTHGR